MIARPSGQSNHPFASGPREPVLVLGGTVEGREIAGALADSQIPAISSLAGRVSAPRLPPGPVRIGGFGGVDGLAEFLVEQRISAVVDATHPFAARITANAVGACARTGTPLLILRRPAWVAAEPDRWTRVPDLTAAAAHLVHHDPDAAVLLTVGRQGVGAFSAASQRFWVRAVDPPAAPLPERTEIILDRGPFTVAGELELMRRLAIDVVVTKNSGGPMTAAKLAAARALALPVIVVDRPPLPAGARSAGDTATALAWLQQILATG